MATLVIWKDFVIKGSSFGGKEFGYPRRGGFIGENVMRMLSNMYETKIILFFA